MGAISKRIFKTVFFVMWVIILFPTVPLMAQDKKPSEWFFPGWTAKHHITGP